MPKSQLLKFTASIFVFINFALNAQPFQRAYALIVADQIPKATKILDSCAHENLFQDSVLFYKALGSLKGGDQREAGRLAKKLSRKYPGFGESDFLTGMIAFSAARYGNAVDGFSRAIAVHPHHLRARFNRSLAFGMLEEYALAIADLTDCIAQQPSNSQFYYSRAYWNERKNDLNAALNDYEKTVQLDPRNFDAWLGIAFIYKTRGDTTRACSTLKQAIEAGSQIGSELEGYCK